MDGREFCAPAVALMSTCNQSIFGRLAQELTSKVDRSITPWVVAMWHSPWYEVCHTFLFRSCF